MFPTAGSVGGALRWAGHPHIGVGQIAISLVFLCRLLTQHPRIADEVAEETHALELEKHAENGDHTNRKRIESPGVINIL